MCRSNAANAILVLVESVERTKLGEFQEYLHVGRVLLGLVKGIQGLCGGKVAVTETKRKLS